jgi:hypothetical protein
MCLLEKNATKVLNLLGSTLVNFQLFAEQIKVDGCTFGMKFSRQILLYKPNGELN